MNVPIWQGTHAGYGYCASHSHFLWGFRLYLNATPDGMPIIWGLTNRGVPRQEFVV